MKEPITVYVQVKASENLPIGTATAKKGEFTGQLQIRKDGAYFYYENTILDYEFSDPRLYEFEWLKPQELITFTKDEWSEQEKAAELFQQTIDNQTNIIIEKDDEIARLKGLIEDQFLKGLRGWGNSDQRQQVLQEFKIENKL
mgnify:CR=1 FL=1